MGFGIIPSIPYSRIYFLVSSSSSNNQSNEISRAYSLSSSSFYSLTTSSFIFHEDHCLRADIAIILHLASPFYFSKARISFAAYKEGIRCSEVNPSVRRRNGIESYVETIEIWHFEVHEDHFIRGGVCSEFINTNPPVFRRLSSLAQRLQHRREDLHSEDIVLYTKNLTAFHFWPTPP
jgi:hypothetical protein